MSDKDKNMVLYVAVYDNVGDALADLDGIEQLHKDSVIGKFDAAVIQQQDGKAKIVKRLDRPSIRVIPEVFGGGTLPSKELKQAAAELDAGEAALILAGEPTIEKALDKLVTRTAKVVKHDVDETTDQVAAELHEALQS